MEGAEEKKGWKKSSKKYRKSKVDNDFVAINKYVPREMREPLHRFVNEQVELFLSSGISATKLKRYVK